MKKLFDLSVATGNYTARDGSKKTHWENVGLIAENDNGKQFIMLKATFNPAAVDRPVGMSSIIISIFPVNENRNAPEAELAEASNFGDGLNPNPPF